MKKKIELQAVSLTFYSEWSCNRNDKAYVEFVYEGAHYHVWLAISKQTIRNPNSNDETKREYSALIEPLQVELSGYNGKAILHKNPLDGIKKGDIGYFPHVALNANNAAWRKIIEQAFSCVNVATDRAAYVKAYKAKEAEQVCKHVQSLRAERITKFASYMYELLLKMREAARADICAPINDYYEKIDNILLAIDNIQLT